MVSKLEYITSFINHSVFEGKSHSSYINGSPENKDQPKIISKTFGSENLMRDRELQKLRKDRKYENLKFHAQKCLGTANSHLNCLSTKLKNLREHCMFSKFH